MNAQHDLENRANLALRRSAGWGNYPTAACAVQTLHDEPVDLADWAAYPQLTPRGLGRSYGDASLPIDGGLQLDFHRQNRILGFDPDHGVVRAAAGASLAQVLQRVVKHGWFLPVTPGTKFVTLGGALAANVHGKNHHRVGAIQNYVERFTIMTELGELSAAPRQNADLFESTIGGFGMTGLIQDITLRLKPIQTAYVRVDTFKATHLDDLFAKLDQREHQHEYSLVWIDTFASGRSFGRGIGQFADHAARDDLAVADRTRPLEPPRQAALPSPPPLPSLLRRCGEAAFARLFYHLPRRSTGLRPFESYFYPLDRVTAWNRVYGRSGFQQYQCVLPFQGDAQRAVCQILQALRRARVSSFVAGLKSMQADTVGLPFGMPGLTLGVDFDRRHADLENLFAALDRIVIEHGGRVALSKDSRLGAAAFREMYPEFEQWRSTVRGFAPNGRFGSRMARRLQWLE